MEGRNMLSICQSEMQRALSTYLSEHVFREPVKVIEVRAEREVGTTHFALEIERADDPATTGPGPRREPE